MNFLWGPGLFSGAIYLSFTEGRFVQVIRSIQSALRFGGQKINETENRAVGGTLRDGRDESFSRGGWQLKYCFMFHPLLGEDSNFE